MTLQPGQYLMRDNGLYCLRVDRILTKEDFKPVAGVEPFDDDYWTGEFIKARCTRFDVKTGIPQSTGRDPLVTLDLKPVSESELEEAHPIVAGSPNRYSVFTEKNFQLGLFE
jgi:hypothetical protein